MSKLTEAATLLQEIVADIATEEPSAPVAADGAVAQPGFEPRFESDDLNQIDAKVRTAQSKAQAEAERAIRDATRRTKINAAMDLTVAMNRDLKELRDGDAAPVPQPSPPAEAATA